MFNGPMTMPQGGAPMAPGPAMPGGPMGAMGPQMPPQIMPPAPPANMTQPPALGGAPVGALMQDPRIRAYIQALGAGRSASTPFG